MTLANIIKAINAKLAGELFAYPQLVPYLDDVIDDVNTRLCAKFPAFSDLPAGSTEYTAIPDKYLRSVVIPGTVFKFYVMDEEGSATAPLYENEYNKNLFYMERDYMCLVPEEYIDNETDGQVHFSEQNPLHDGGFVINVGSFIL